MGPTVTNYDLYFKGIFYLFQNIQNISFKIKTESGALDCPNPLSNAEEDCSFIVNFADVFETLDARFFLLNFAQFFLVFARKFAYSSKIAYFEF